MILRQTFSRQVLERVPEPQSITDQADNVLAYDQVMTTKLAIAYAIGIEFIYRSRPEPFGGEALDLACGPGHMSLCMAKHLKLDRLIGVDMSEPMIAKARKNADEQNAKNVTFNVADATDLSQYPDDSFDLCTFCDAAHHMPDIESVRRVFSEMDRVTRPGALVFVMDLVRLKTARVTDDYVSLLGADYKERGLNSFYDDFCNSMYAAWTQAEISRAVPTRSSRDWTQLTPIGLPTVQMIVGRPKQRDYALRRRTIPWVGREAPLARSLRADWRALRLILSVSRAHSLSA